jgi:hypothetical protein
LIINLDRFEPFDDRAEARTELRGLLPELFVGELADTGLQRVDLLHDGNHSLHVALVLRAENCGEDFIDHEELLKFKSETADGRDASAVHGRSARCGGAGERAPRHPERSEGPRRLRSFAVFAMVRLTAARSPRLAATTDEDAARPTGASVAPEIAPKAMARIRYRFILAA